MKIVRSFISILAVFIQTSAWAFAPISNFGVAGGFQLVAGDNLHRSIVRLDYYGTFAGFLGVGRLENLLVARCSGTLVHENYILTAAHCFNTEIPLGLVPRLRVVAIFFNPDRPTEVLARVPLEAIGANSSVQNGNPVNLVRSRNDLAIYRLMAPAPRGSISIPIANVETESGALPPETPLVFAGFGLDERGHQVPSLKFGRGVTEDLTRDISYYEQAVQSSTRLIREYQAMVARYPNRTSFRQDVNNMASIRRRDRAILENLRYRALHSNSVEETVESGIVRVGDSGGPMIYFRTPSEPVLVGVIALAEQSTTSDYLGRQTYFHRLYTAPTSDPSNLCFLKNALRMATAQGECQ